MFVVDVLVFSYVSVHSDEVLKKLKRSNEATAIHKIVGNRQVFIHVYEE